MTVYLGTNGAVQLRRKSGDPIRGTLLRGDVSVLKRRFSLNEYDVWGELITGDQVDIERVGGGNLELVKDHDYPDWRGYIFVDQLGGLRLYEDFSPALTGSPEQALELIEPSGDQSLRITTRNGRFNYLAQVRSFEVTTERDTIDITMLGDQFKRKYEAGLISGQGRLDCFWEFKRELCGPADCGAGSEFPMYLAQLCIRLTQGADFLGRFFIYHPEQADTDDVRGNEQSVWYEAECLVTNVTVNVEATGIIESSVDFVTTNRIKLLTGVAPSFLLQEDTALLLQEDGDSRIVLAGSDV